MPDQRVQPSAARCDHEPPRLNRGRYAARQKPMDHAENVAKTIVEGLLPGSRMAFNVDQSSGVHDFDLQLPDGTVAAVEVTAAVDEVRMRTTAAILAHAKGGPAIKTHRCKKDWYIEPQSTLG